MVNNLPPIRGSLNPLKSPIQNAEKPLLNISELLKNRPAQPKIMFNGQNFKQVSSEAPGFFDNITKICRSCIQSPPENKQINSNFCRIITIEERGNAKHVHIEKYSPNLAKQNLGKNFHILDLQNNRVFAKKGLNLDFSNANISLAKDIEHEIEHMRNIEYSIVYLSENEWSMLLGHLENPTDSKENKETIKKDKTHNANIDSKDKTLTLEESRKSLSKHNIKISNQPPLPVAQSVLDFRKQDKSLELERKLKFREKVFEWLTEKENAQISILRSKHMITEESKKLRDQKLGENGLS